MAKKNINNTKKVTLCEKVKITQIYSPVADWKEFHKVFKILQKETILASNKIISICNIFNSFDNKEEQKDWLIKKYQSEKLRNVLYEVARKYCYYLYSRNANAISNDIYYKYFNGPNSYKVKVQKGIGNPPMTFTESIPLYITVQRHKIECTNNDRHYYTIEVPLLNNNCKSGIQIKDTEEKIQVNNNSLIFGINASRNKRLINILDNIISGNYEFCDSKLKRVKSKKRNHKYDYYFLLSYKKPVIELKTLKPENVLGVDLGMTVPAYCAVNYCDYKKKAVGDSRIIRYNLMQEKINKRIQRNIKYNLRDCHGRKYKLDGYDGASNKIAKRNSTYNFNLASEIVQLAIKWQCGTIHLEDLTKIHEINPQNRFLKNWTYYDLQQKIENKANEYGIVVKYINPYHTSQTCSNCGHFEAGQRISQALFQCKYCGYSVNADYNAARNIALYKILSGLN